MHADLAEPGAERVVHIGKHAAVPDREPGRAAQHQIFADRRDQMRQLFLDRAASTRIGCPCQGFELAVAPDRELGDGADKGLERLVAGDEIGLGIDLDKGAGGAAGGNPDQPFGGDSPGLFGGGRQPLFAQPVDRGLDVAVAVAERALAIHHAGAGLVAQLLDQRRGHLGHLSSSSLSPPRARRGGSSFQCHDRAVDRARLRHAPQPARPPPGASPHRHPRARRRARPLLLRADRPSRRSARAPMSTPEAASSACNPSSTALDTRSQ